jgi:vancomycin resistance protein VanJ
MVRWLRFGLLALTSVYIIGYGLWRILLRSPLYDQLWQLQLSEVLGSWAYLPLLPLIVLAGLIRHRVALLLLVIPLLFFAIEYGRQFLPNWSRTNEAVTTLRVLTWNTLYSGDYNGEFQTLIQRLQPDYIAIQEVNWRMVQLFKNNLSTDYPYQIARTAGAGGGLALFSRYPLDIAPSPYGVMSCQCITITSDVAGQSITLIIVHIWRPDIDLSRYGRLPVVKQFSSGFQTPIFDQLLERIAAVDGPLVVLGDFNTTERQPNYWRLRRLLKDSFAQAGWGLGHTFPANLRARGWAIPPLVRIDHILISDHWQALAAWTGQLSTSDHGFVVADLALREWDTDDWLGWLGSSIQSRN